MDGENNAPQKDDRFQKINSLILANEEFLVVADAESFDSVAAATGLTLFLKSLGKKVTLYSPKNLKIENGNSLLGTNEFINKLPNDSNKLFLTFNCPIDQIEKVSSNDEEGKLTLSVELKKGSPTIDTSAIEMKQGKSVFSAGFFIGIALDNEEELTKGGSWVCFSREGTQRMWAKVNVIEKQATLSESISSFISNSNFRITTDAASNFYQGIRVGTNNFEEVDSIAMETAAFCLRIKEEGSKIEKVGGQTGEKDIPQTPLEMAEKKEDATSDAWQKPQIFTGKTTPRV